MSHMRNNAVLFKMGRLGATPGALDAVKGEVDKILPFVERHVTGDWSENCKRDQLENRRAIKTSARIVSKYALISKEIIYIITECDRSSTTIMLAHEY